jgi:septin family protein
MQPDDQDDTDVQAAMDRIPRTVHIQERVKNIQENGVNLRLTIVDTPGFSGQPGERQQEGAHRWSTFGFIAGVPPAFLLPSDAVDNTECWTPLVDYLDDAYNLYLMEEAKLDRSNVVDKRVHALLYFLSPSSRG